MKRPVHVSIGPPVPNVPYKDFSSMNIPADIFSSMWDIVGPSISVNMNNGLPLWKVMTMAYIEGFMHGQGLTEELHAAKMRSLQEANRSRRSSLHDYG